MTPGAQLLTLLRAEAPQATQAEIARRLGTTQGTVSDVLRGATDPTLDTVVRWAATWAAEGGRTYRLVAEPGDVRVERVRG